MKTWTLLLLLALSTVSCKSIEYDDTEPEDIYQEDGPEPISEEKRKAAIQSSPPGKVEKKEVKKTKKSQ